MYFGYSVIKLRDSHYNKVIKNKIFDCYGDIEITNGSSHNLFSHNQMSGLHKGSCKGRGGPMLCMLARCMCTTVFYAILLHSGRTGCGI